MSTLIEMQVFSGVPNPRWVISGEEETEFKRLQQSARVATAPDEGPGLGYRGFSILEPDPELAPRGPIHHVGSPELETFLLRSAHDGGHISTEVFEHSTQVIAAAVTRFGPIREPHCPPCHAADAPVYNPAIWNTPAVQPHNNCYNYANNQITNTFAQPGRATGHMYTALTCPSVQAGALSDGLVGHGNFTTPLGANHGWYVALVIWPGLDYHWYRQDKVGCWSHKPGGTAARNVDNAGHAISDPKTCNRGPYTVFCTYMITKRTVRIR